ncbi:MAG: hypothetical protein ABSD38_31735, partial [Syntrophorhabdales bacterium]
SALFHSSFRVGSIVGKQLILLRKEDSCEGLIESNRIFRVSGVFYFKCTIVPAKGSGRNFFKPSDFVRFHKVERPACPESG